MSTILAEERDHSRESQKVGETRQEDSLEQIFQEKMTKQILTSQKKKPPKHQTNDKKLENNQSSSELHNKQVHLA